MLSISSQENESIETSLPDMQTSRVLLETLRGTVTVSRNIVLDNVEGNALMYKSAIALIILGFAGAIIYKIPTQTTLDPPVWMQILGTVVWAWPYEVLAGLGLIVSKREKR